MSAASLNKFDLGKNKGAEGKADRRWIGVMVTVREESQQPIMTRLTSSTSITTALESKIKDLLRNLELDMS
jgi:hypothetical protein